MRIAVVGSGYVGLVAGACFADLGHDVILVDNDERKLSALKNGQVPIHENFLPELLGRHRGQRLLFPTICAKRCAPAQPSSLPWAHRPPRAERPTFLSSNPLPVKSPAQSMTIKSSWKRVRSRSTPANGFAKSFCATAPTPDSFDVASNPEFLREGTAVTDFLFPDRIVVGCDNERCANVLREIYAPLTSGSYYQTAGAIPQPDRTSIPAPIIVTSTKSAELIKHASNAFLAMKISFINAVSSMCESVGRKCESGVSRHWH